MSMMNICTFYAKLCVRELLLRCRHFASFAMICRAASLLALQLSTNKLLICYASFLFRREMMGADGRRLRAHL